MHWKNVLLRGADYLWTYANGRRYLVVTEINNRGDEIFDNFYIKRKAPVSRSFRTDLNSTRTDLDSANTPEGARADTEGASFTGKDTKNSPTNQTNPKQSVKRVFRPSYPNPSPLLSPHQYHSRRLRPLLPRQQGKKIPPSQEARDNLVLMLPQAVLFEVLSISLQTPKESPSTLQRYEKKRPKYKEQEDQ